MHAQGQAMFLSAKVIFAIAIFHWWWVWSLMNKLIQVASYPLSSGVLHGENDPPSTLWFITVNGKDEVLYKHSEFYY